MRRNIFDTEGHAHFVTFSCFRRRRLLEDNRAKQIVLHNLTAQLNRTRGVCVGFVVMPNHVHAIVWHELPDSLADLMKQWKRMSSYLIGRLPAEFQATQKLYEPTERNPIWQARYYDFNLFEPSKVEEKLTYMHQNPVRAGLVRYACDWLWSSARYYERGEETNVPIGWVV